METSKFIESSRAIVDVDFISSFWRNARTATAMQGEIKCVAPWRGTSLDMRTYVAALANRRRPSHGGWELRLESQIRGPT